MPTWFTLAELTQKKDGRTKTVFTEVTKAAATEAFQIGPKESIWQYQQKSGVSFASA